DCIGLPNDVVVEEDAHFMLSGGDSLQALRLCDEITVAMGTTSLGLLEVILDGSFSDVVSHVMTETHSNAIQPSKKRMLDDSGPVVLPKRQHKEMSTENATESTAGFVVPLVGRTTGFVVVRQAGEVTDWGCIQKIQEKNFSDALGASQIKFTVTNTSEDTNVGLISNPAINKITERHVPQEVTEMLPVTKCTGIGEGSREEPSDVLPLGLQAGVWMPLQTTVFIGSHSHRLQALDLSNGEVIWERILGDRLESSAA
ncbi:hypothetical protein M9458_040270, partial [Cirrhinus mrigala]